MAIRSIISTPLAPKTSSGGFLTYAPTPVAAGAPAGTSAGALTSPLTGPVFSILSGNLSVNASTGALTTTATAPSTGSISAHVRVQDSTNANAEELTISVPVTVTLGTLTLSTTDFATGQAAGTVLATISGQTSGSSVTIAVSDTSGLFAVSGANLLAGPNFAAAPAEDVSVQLTETLATATNSPHTSTIPAMLTAAASSALPRLSQVATRTGIFNAVYPSTGAYMAASQHYSRDAISAIKVGFSNFWNNTANGSGSGESSSSMAAPAMLHASIEYPIGSTPVPLTFAGQTAGIAPTLGLIFSDLVSLPYTIPANAAFRVRHHYSGAGGAIPITNQTSTTSNDYYTLGNGAPDTTTSAGTSGLGSMGGDSWLPLAIVANTAVQSVAAWGDSRNIGYGDTAGSTGDMGEICKSLGPTLPYINLGTYGDFLSAQVAYGNNRKAVTRLCTYATSEAIINALVANSTASAEYTNLQNLMNSVSGIPFYINTTAPKSSSTDGYATVANQTPFSNNAQRVAWNTALRNGSYITAPVLGYFDTASVVESSLNSGVWAVGDVNTSDGLHESAAGYTAIKTAGVVTPSSFASAPATVSAVPFAPILTIAAGNGQAVLSLTELNPNRPAIQYQNVYRATTSAGVATATPVRVGFNGQGLYTDTSVTNGTTYYWAVTSVNSAGESAQSNIVTCRPAAAPTHAMVLNGTNGAGFQTPISSALQDGGFYDVEVWCNLTSLTALAGLFGDTAIDNSFKAVNNVTPLGRLAGNTGTIGSTQSTAGWSVAAPFSPSGTWLRFVVNMTGSAVTDRFSVSWPSLSGATYCAPDVNGSPGTYVKMGSTVTGISVGTFTPNTSGSFLQVGPAYGTATPYGSIYEVKSWSRAGSLLLNPNFTLQATGTTSFTDGSGVTWTATGGGSIS